MLIRRLTLAIIFLSLFAASGCKKSEPVTQEQVKDDVNQAIETTGKYLGQKKDAVIAQTKEMYSKFESEIQSFLSGVKNQSEEKKYLGLWRLDQRQHDTSILWNK